MSNGAGTQGGGAEEEEETKRRETGGIHLFPPPKLPASTNPSLPVHHMVPFLGGGTGSQQGTSMMRPRVLLLICFLLPGLLPSEAAKILTVSLVGECLAKESRDRSVPGIHARAQANSPRSEGHPVSFSRLSGFVSLAGG